MYPMNCAAPRAGSVSPSNGNRWGHSAQAPACQQMPPARTADNGIEAMAKSDPFLSPAKQQVRQSRSGLDKGGTATYAESCEFVSLGCFCAVAHALQVVLDFDCSQMNNFSSGNDRDCNKLNGYGVFLLFCLTFL